MRQESAQSSGEGNRFAFRLSCLWIGSPIGLPARRHLRGNLCVLVGESASNHFIVIVANWIHMLHLTAGGCAIEQHPFYRTLCRVYSSYFE
jgi:hypothetical protein